ncbi:GNAT family N-acetyltransferase [Cytobacillus sp. FSL W7-1323]|uniref:GNAT family N-acetyltransferase n=1 Tax=Cytobacillus TaxID=2675230 RepID=UPI002AFFF4AA|nr:MULTISPECIES: GNAT family N-acetyltransferase [Cytobacillus]MEA1855511.1 GNAT family N-acetyltransferase [Cytobacillus sp. OWB-43]MED1608124.1 GNAT family N-acetyltransferase [Cytobacillus kochii]
MLYLKQAQLEELDEIMSIIDRARETIVKRGIPQWQDGDGPNREIITQDISNKEAYVLMADERKVGIGTILTAPEEPYEQLVNWEKAETPYASIHRVAIDPEIQGKGYSTILLQHLITAARLNGFRDIRIDTHPENEVMQKVIQKAGFSYIGDVELDVPNGNRFAYQILLK